MSDNITGTEISKWLSTYGILTAQRVLECYRINLSATDLIAAINHSDNVYYHLLKIPVKHLLNGIIIQQATDYQVYAQKLFVDYMLSGEADKSPDSPDANTRNELEKLRLNLVSNIEALSDLNTRHQKLIAASQKALIELTNELRPKLKSVNLTDSFGVEEKMADYLEQTDAIHVDSCDFRTQFYEAILKTTELLNLLADYRIDPINDAINREALHFDPTIGSINH